MTTVANPNRVKDFNPYLAPETQEEVMYGIFNDRTFFDPLFESGEIASVMEDLRTQPLFTSTVLPEAIRQYHWFNEQRRASGTLGKYGKVVLRRDVIVRSGWMDVSGEEIEGTDDGRRAYGR